MEDCVKAYIVFFLLVCFFVKVNAETPADTAADAALRGITAEREKLNVSVHESLTQLDFEKRKVTQLNQLIADNEAKMERLTNENDNNIPTVMGVPARDIRDLSTEQLRQYQGNLQQIDDLQKSVDTTQKILSDKENLVKTKQTAYDTQLEAFNKKYQNQLSDQQLANQEVAEINRRISKANLLMEYSHVMENLNNANLNLLVMREKIDQSVMGVYVKSALSDFLTTGNRLCDAVKSCPQASKK